MARGDYGTACPKFAESQRLDPGGGTLTALAACHEGQGKTASAWAEFLEVVASARRDGRVDRERFARAHIAALEPRLSRLSLEVPRSVAAETQGLKVLRDGEEVGAPSWGSFLPIDPGEHSIVVSAAGKLPWKITVDIGAKADRRTVTVPPLEDAPPESPAPAPVAVLPPSSASDSISRRTNSGKVIGFILGGVGVAALGAGAFFGIEAITKSSSARAACPSFMSCSQAALSENSTAKTDALVSDITLGAAVAALGVSTVLLLTSHNRSTESPARSSRVVPVLSPSVGGIAWTTCF
jgi:hypothetical protein